MTSNKEIFEKIYHKKAVWTETKPPKELIDLLKNKKIKPGKVLDVGCGEGFYSIYLALNKFKVTGIDLSEEAIKSAKENAREKNIKIKFKQLDIKNLEQINNRYDFILEWAVMHHIAPLKRKKYINDVYRLLKKEGKYLSVCFNNQNPDFGQKGKNLRIVPEGAKMPAGTKLYYSSLDDITKLFEVKFHILKSKLIKMTTGAKEHIGNCILMEKNK